MSRTPPPLPPPEPPEPPGPEEGQESEPATRRWDASVGRFEGSPDPRAARVAAGTSLTRVWILAVLLGITFLLLGRFVFGGGAGEYWVGAMSVAFLFGIPFAMGFLVVGVVALFRPVGALGAFVGPVVASLLALVMAVLAGWEGTICVVMWLPVFLPMAALGGGAAMALRGPRRKGPRSLVLTCVALLPFVGAPIEARLATAADLRRVESAIEIAADPETVWRQIERVPAIRADEHAFAWSHAIGFPRPVEATLVGRGIGAVRHATFEGGVLFVETITEWQPGRSLAFTIRADTRHIPPGTLDEHVTVGGPYFDVLDGRYEIVPLGPGRVRLVLTSTHRLSTTFNAYARLWTDFVMRDVQDAILGIVKRRCERP